MIQLGSRHPGRRHASLVHARAASAILPSNSFHLRSSTDHPWRSSRCAVNSVVHIRSLQNGALLPPRAKLELFLSGWNIGRMHLELLCKRLKPAWPEAEGGSAWLNCDGPTAAEPTHRTEPLLAHLGPPRLQEVVCMNPRGKIAPCFQVTFQQLPSDFSAAGVQPWRLRMHRSTHANATMQQTSCMTCNDRNNLNSMHALLYVERNEC